MNNNLVEATDTRLLMTRDEARAAVEAIKAHIQQARALLLDLHQREGWRSLGYSSWEDCVTEEFGHSRSYMYRQLAAARLELEVGSEIGAHPESHLRAINETLEDEEQKQEAYKLAAATGASSAGEYKRFAMEVWLKRNLPQGSMINERVKAGIISTQAAYEIGRMAMNDELDAHTRTVVGFCTDPELAEMLVHVSRAMPELWEEIVSTGSLPGIEENMPLGKAKASDLKAFLTLDSAERRAQHVERHRDYYDERQEIIKEVIREFRSVLWLIENERFEVVKLAAQPMRKLLERLDELDL